MARSFPVLHCLVLLASLFPRAAPQTISTSTPVPPLQWINLSDRLQGSDNAPPPLMDAAIGYDETTRTIIVFGGESENGFPQDTTYLLNLDSLTWSNPSPPSNLNDRPAARSAAIAGYDAASSYRSGFVVIGGKSRDGDGLSDVWEFDFNNEFWSEVTVSAGGPSGRWGASGGIDIRTDPNILNNTFYLAGGYDGTDLSRLSDVWTLDLSGVLSPNLPDQVAASWDRVSFDNLPRKIGQAGTVLGQQIIAAGGCNTTSTDDDSCALGDSYVISTSDGQVISPGACPAGRRGAVLVPNMNSYSSSFSSQVFFLLGTFDSSLWDDGGGLDKGEVSVLDTNTGTWARVIPSGDPDSNDSTPTPREGAAAVTYRSGLVGSHRSQSVDTIMFGGRDNSGSYLNEVWLLRAYNGAVSSSGSWSGGSGDLESGADASGAGVRVEYMTQCASALAPASSESGPSSTSAGPSATTTGSSPTQTSTPSASTASYPYDTSTNHKVLSTVSVVLLFPAALIYRLSSPSYTAFARPARRMFGLYSSVVLVLVAYALGIAGLALSFTSLASTSSATLSRRDSASTAHLKTAHGRAGLVLFVLLYVVLPLLLLLRLGSRKLHNRSASPTYQSEGRELKGVELTETPPHARARSPTQSFASSAETRPRTMSLPLSTHNAPMSTESTEGGKRSFEVLNRGHRPSRPSRPATSMSLSSPHVLSRSLGELDWLQRRRSLNAVGELDYAISQVLRQQTQPATPNTTDALMGNGRAASLPSIPELPPVREIVLRVLFHAALLALCALCLVALYLRAPVWAFTIFLVWVVAFYAVMLVLAWRGTPPRSTLTAVLFRLRGRPIPPRDTSTIASAPLGDNSSYPFPTAGGRGPYVHTPTAYRAGNDDGASSHPLSAEGQGYEDEEDEEDEDVQQRRMEEEMDRRDVSIVTVPKRRLWVANPS
ncbi:hypothetical protein BD626DRAFT_479127 [Schizophyllum amplum]|uniref:Cortical protein marker for cell polarity-domain-containing protein n=1 Tax=Schizophyllum amplum TaxID=97359 RepID=A0A550CRZ8_9AGAR|nr:hypothetical protein BD626DRAFT_479127 [Auriculariopsis ampla]